MKKRNPGWLSFLLAFALLLGLAPMAAPAQAASGVATTVVVTTDYGTDTVWTLQDGDYKEGRDRFTASYEDGVLTLTDASGSSNNVGCYEIITACYASIYADGNLTIRFEGDSNSCTFNAQCRETEFTEDEHPVEATVCEHCNKACNHRGNSFTGFSQRA